MIDEKDIMWETINSGDVAWSDSLESPKEPEVGIQPVRALKEGTKDVGRSTLQFVKGSEEARDLEKEASRFGVSGKAGPLQSLLTDQQRQDIINARGQGKTDIEGLEAGQQAMLSDITSALDSKWLRPDKTLKRPDGFSGYTQDVLRMVPQIVAQIGTTAVGGPVAGGAFMATQIGGSDYERLTKEGVEPERAFKAAVSDAIMQTPLEQIGMAKALSMWKPGKAAGKFIKGAAEAGFVGWLTETLQKYPELASDIWAKGEGLDNNERVDQFIDGAWKTFKEGAYEGAVAAPFEAITGGMGSFSSQIDTDIPETQKTPQEQPEINPKDIIINDLVSGEQKVEDLAALRDSLPEQQAAIIDEAIADYESVRPNAPVIETIRRDKSELPQMIPQPKSAEEAAQVFEQLQDRYVEPKSAEESAKVFGEKTTDQQTREVNQAIIDQIDQNEVEWEPEINLAQTPQERELGTQESGVKPEDSVSEFNTQNPEHSLKYDGEQDRSAINKPPLYNFTAYEGPAKGATFSVESPTVENIKAKLDEMVGLRSKVIDEKNLSDQEKSYRKAKEDFSKVMDDPASASEKELVKAIGYLGDKMYDIGLKIQKGQKGLDESYHSLEVERDGLKEQIKLRRDAGLKYDEQPIIGTQDRRKSERRQPPQPDPGDAPAKVADNRELKPGETLPERRTNAERRQAITAGDTVRHKRAKYQVEEIEDDRALISNARLEKIVPLSELSQWGQPKKPVEVQQPTGEKKSVGMAWMGAAWKPVTAAYQIQRGKNKGKYRVTLPSGRKKLVDEKSVRLIDVERQPETAKIKGTKQIAQRIINAENRFIESVQEQFGKTKKEAENVFKRFKKDKIVKIDPVGGQYNLKDGRFWEQTVIDRAAKKQEFKPARRRKSKGPVTLRGRIRQAGGINFLNFKGEIKQMDTAVKFLSKKNGIPIDSLEKTLKTEGWIQNDETLLDLLNNKEVLKRGKIAAVDTEAKTEFQRKQERKFKESAEHEPDAPPPGDYVEMRAEDLPEGAKLTIIEGNSIDGWDEYQIDQTPSGVRLKDGTTIELDPWDTIQVRKQDLPKDVTAAKQAEIETEPSLFEEPQRATRPKAEKPKKAESGQEQKDMFGFNQSDMFGRRSDIDKETKREKQISKIKNTLKNETGSSELANDILTKGAELYQSGAKTFGRFRREMRKAFKDVWEKIKKHIRNIWDLISNQRGELKIGQGDKESTDLIERYFGPEVARQAKYSDTLEPVTAQDYIENRKSSSGIARKALRNAKAMAKEIKTGTDTFIGAISTRLANINPKLKTKIRKLDFDIAKLSARDIQAVEPLLRKVKDDMSKNDMADWDYARKNSDKEKIDFLVNKYGLQDEYRSYRKVLDGIRDEAIDVGLMVGEIEEYAPRILGDKSGFLNAIERGDDFPYYGRILKERAEALGMTVADMPIDYKADLISNAILSGPRGLAGPSATKQRKLRKIPSYLNKYYMDSDSALLNHIYSMRKNIEARKFFGRVPNKVAEIRRRLRAAQAKLRELNKQKTKDTKKINKYIGLVKQYEAYIEKFAMQRDFKDSIGAYIVKLIEDGEIDPDQERVLSDILNARFHERGTHGVVQAYKNISYIDTMGSPTSALTQIGDLAWSAYDSGLVRTIKNAAKSLAGKSKITKEDVGIERIAQEFADPGTLGNAVSKVFKVIGLEKIDSIGKEALLNSSLERYQKEARRNPEKLKSKIKVIFEGETDGVIDDLINGDITENVKLLVYHRMLDFQPVALSEMPQRYLSAGNGRLFYMLKTFTIKQFDVFRNEAYNKIKNGNRSEKLQGVKNLVRLSMFFVLANAGADFLKDWLLGRKTDPEDMLIDNVLRLFGASKYMTWKARTEGLGSAVTRMIFPPFKFIDSLSKDVASYGDGKGFESIGSIPVIGKLAYWHLGKGKNKRSDLWDRRLRKAKRKLKSVAEGYEESDNKSEYRRKHSSKLKRYRSLNNLQGRLNALKKRINAYKSRRQTKETKIKIQNLEERRIQMIKKFLNSGG